jgi:NADPH:quinone reductase-like Zn-dependent oxidoreductase
MKAIRQHRFGGPGVLQLEEISSPQPKAGQVALEVHVAGVNPVDAKIRAGKFKLFKPRLPAIIGRDIAGIVSAVGPGPAVKQGTAPFRVGDAVFGLLDYERGAYAGCVVAAAHELAHRPRRLPETVAGSLGVAALTAWQGLFDHGRLQRGQRVLIHGGAGGVGHLAVQFAKVRGASVIATAGRRDLAWVRSLGADRVIDYKNECFENEVGNIDLVFDLIAGETQDRSWQVLKENGGRLVSTLSQPSSTEARRHRARGIRMVVKSNPAQLAEIARLIVAKKVRVKIARTFPLAQVRRAHVLLEQGHFRGKLALRVR